MTILIIADHEAGSLKSATAATAARAIGGEIHL